MATTTTRQQQPRTHESRKFKFTDGAQGTIAKRARPSDKPVEYTDTDCAGLYVRVETSGIKTFWFRYRVYNNVTMKAGDQFRRRLGRWPGMSLAEARRIGHDARAKAQGGVHPFPEDIKPEDGQLALPKTIRALVDAYVEHGKNVANKKAMLRDELQGPFGHLAPHALTSAELRPVFKKLLDDRPKSHPRGSKLRTYITALYNWANHFYDVQLSNPAATFTPKYGYDWEQAKEVVAFKDHQLPKVWEAAELAGHPCSEITRLMLFTGQRNEVWTKAKWSWWQHDGLHIPKSMDTATKRYPRYLPRTPAVEKIIEAQLERCDDTSPEAPMFPMTGREKRLSENLFAHLDIKPDDPEREVLKLYSARHTAETSMRRLGLAGDVINEIMGHARQGVGHARYNHHEYSDEKREALQQLETFIKERVNAQGE